jgi:orotate phosphoribosyltransferase
MVLRMKWSDRKEMLGRKLSTLLYDNGLIKTWYKDNPRGWMLVSGLWSPFYIQLRPISSCPEARDLLKLVGTSVFEILRHEAANVNKLLGVAFAGIPISIATTLVSGIPSCYTRKTEFDGRVEFKTRFLDYGEHSMVEGELRDGDVFAIVDDVVTHFDSKLEALSKLMEEKKRRKVKWSLRCEDVVVLVDREQGAGERAMQLGMRLHSLIPLRSKGIDWLKDRMSEVEYTVIREYLDNPAAFQKEKARLDLYELAERALHVGNYDA